MADRGPNYGIQHKKLELEIEEHRSTIERGEARIAEIARAKKVNLSRVEIANLELDDEATRLVENRTSLEGRIAEIQKNLDLMVKVKE